MILNKKQQGNLGEQCVDDFCIKNCWNIFQKNVYFKGGEIDRIYFKLTEKNNAYFCFAEIKVTTIESSNEISSILSEMYIKKFLKRRQIQNLKKFSEHFHALYCNKFKKIISLARLFIIVKFKIQDGDLPKQIPLFGGKICFQCPTHWILSFEPEFTYGKHSSCMQISY